MKQRRITVDPSKMGGTPIVRDTRVTVTAVLGQLAAGQSLKQILHNYPYLQREDIYAVLEFAAESVQRELPFAAA